MEDLRKYITIEERAAIADKHGIHINSVGYILRGDWKNDEVVATAKSIIKEKAAKMAAAAD